MLKNCSTYKIKHDRVLGWRKRPDNRLASLIGPADIGDHVGHAMGDFYGMATGIVQGIINLFTAGLYHLFVQQLILLYRGQFNASPPPSGKATTTIKERLLQDCKIDIPTFSSWDKLQELRLVANVVKHADGRVVPN